MRDRPSFREGSLIWFGIVLAELVALCLAGAILSWMGLPSQGVVLVFILACLVLLASRARLAMLGHGAPTRLSNSVAVSIEWLSAFGLFGIVAMVFASGHDGFALLIGLVSGFVFSIVLIAPRLSRSPGRSLPDFLSMRYGDERVRLVALAALIVVTVLFVAAQLVAMGLIAEQALGVAPVAGVLIGVLGLLILTLPAGERSLSIGQVSLAGVALMALAIVTIWILSAKTGIVVPHLAYGGYFFDIAAAEEWLGLEAHFGMPSAMLGLRDVLLLVFCFGIGAAVMPHSVRRVSAGEPEATRWGLMRGLILFVIVATALPALAVLAKAEVLALFTASENMLAFEALPHALRDGAMVCDAPARSPEVMRVACEAEGYSDGFSFHELTLDAQRVLMSVPALAGSSPWLIGLLALAALAVSLSAAGGSAQALASGLFSRSSAFDALNEKRIAVFIIALIAATVALTTGLDLISLGAWALSLVGATLFAPLVLGLWWPRATGTGVLVGMICGFVLTATYIIGATWGFDFISETGDEWQWLGVPPMAASAFGIPLALIVSVVGSFLTAAPKAEQIALIEALDTPRLTVDPEAPE